MNSSPKYSQPYSMFTNLKLRPSLLRSCIFLIVVIVINVNVTLLVVKVFTSKSNSENSAVPQVVYKTNSQAIPSLAEEQLAANINIENSNEHKPTLPSFTADKSDYVLSSLIERSFDSEELFVTTFFLSHQLLQPYTTLGSMNVSPSSSKIWKEAYQKFQSLEYEHTGKRSPKYTYTCKIANSAGDREYTSIGSFLPNRAAADTNSNRRIDILRCPLYDSTNATISLRNSDAELQVEIICNRFSLIKFSIPWKSRRTGYILHSKAKTSNINAWAVNKPTLDFKPVVHLSMPGTRLLPTKKNLAMITEYVSHHLNIGFQHIYYTVAMGWESEHMKHFLEFMRSYIEEGRLTISTSSHDSLDSTSSTHGLQWHPVSIKLFHSSMYLFFSKGFADYLAILDTDEFLIPKGAHNSIIDIIRSVDFPPHDPVVSVVSNKKLKNTKGFADGHHHPLCFIMLRSEIVAQSDSDGSSQYPWISNRFSHGSEYNPHNGNTMRFAYPKAILPTRKIFQAGISIGGACKLDWQWTPCGVQNIPKKDFCEGGYGISELNGPEQYSHRFDEAVNAVLDAKAANPWTEGVVYHYLAYHREITASIGSLMNASEYKTRFYPAVKKDLQQRQLEFILSIPDTPPIVYGSVPNKWKKLFTKEEIEESKVDQPQDNIPVVPVGITIDSFPPLPKTFSNRHNQNEVELPDFTVDFTDFVLGSMIERESGTYSLYLTTFFICHSLLEPQVGASAATAESIHPSVLQIWKRAMRVSKSTVYTENGERQQPPRYFCKITHSSSSTTYYANGRFVPNKLTPDSNSNRRLDILRCPMESTREIYENLDKLYKEEMIVEIFKGTEPIIKFRVPWSTRMTGYMLANPAPERVSNYLVSNWNPWKNVDIKTPPELWHHDKLYMCVPGLESAPDKITLPLYLEFIEHHLQLGVDRIFIVAALGWDGKYMNTYLRVLEDYIKEGRVSIQSSAYDGYDLVYSIGGLQWGRDNVKNFYVNMCTYFSKGVADYIAVWDFDELFTPMGKYQNILDLIDAVDVPPTSPIPYFHSDTTKEAELVKSWTGGRGLADNDGHPLCFIVMNSLVTLREKAWQNEWDYTKPWIGQRFNHGQELTLKDGKGLAFYKTIRPTRVAFQGGLHHVGACRLPPAWDGCTTKDKRQFGVCYGEVSELYRVTNNEQGTLAFHLNHRFDEVVLAGDAKSLNLSQAFINHIQFHRMWFGATPEALSRKSEYSARYFNKVLDAIDRKGLELPISLPEKSIFVTRNDKRLLLTSDGWLHPDYFLQPKPIDDSAQIPKTSKLEFSTLPHLSPDGAEMVVASMIDGGFITVFFLSHYVLTHEAGDLEMSTDINDLILGVKREVGSKWQTFLSPSERHPRMQSKFSCILQNNELDKSYEVVGEWVDAASSFVNISSLDVMRCPIHVAELDVLDYYRSNILAKKEFLVQVNRGNEPLVRYRIPWTTRVQGQFLSPLCNGMTSKFNPWRGIIAVNASTEQTNKKDKLYFFLSSYDITPARQSIALLLEFVQHHVILGVDHIFISTAFAEDSQHTKRLERALRIFILNGQVSIFSQVIRASANEIGISNFDFIYGADGLAWSHEVAESIQNELLLAYVHNQADYAGIWDPNTYLIPNKLLSSGENPVHFILENAETKGFFKCTPTISSQKHQYVGISATLRHPCHIEIPTQTLIKYVIPTKDRSAINHNVSYWIGDLYRRTPHGNAMRIPPGDKNKIFRLKEKPLESSHTGHHYAALAYTFSPDKADVSTLPTNSIENHYTSRYFSEVKRLLYEKRLDLLVNIPLRIRQQFTPDHFWTNYFKAWDDRDK